MNTPHNPDLATHLRHKRLLTALVMGLLLHVLVLANDGMIDTLSVERRIVLVLVALRLLIMAHSSFAAVDPAQPAPKPAYTGWRAGILPLFLAAPPLVVFWLAAWSTRGQLHGVTSYALASSVIALLLVLNFVGQVMKRSQKTSPADGNVHAEAPDGNFVMDCLFFTAYGLILAVGMTALMALAPDVLEDSIAVGSLAFYVYVMTWVVQGIVWFFSNVSREAANKAEVIP